MRQRFNWLPLKRHMGGDWVTARTSGRYTALCHTGVITERSHVDASV